MEPVSDRQTQYQCNDGCEIEISDLFRAEFVEGVRKMASVVLIPITQAKARQ